MRAQGKDQINPLSASVQPSKSQSSLKIYHVHGGEAHKNIELTNSVSIVAFKNTACEAGLDGIESSKVTDNSFDDLEASRVADENDLWIEKYDRVWLGIGYFVLMVLTLLVPLALVFNVPFILWVWWLCALGILLAVLVMRVSDVQRFDAHSISLKHVHFLFLFLVVAMRYAVMGTFVGGIEQAIAVSTIQLFALALIAWLVGPDRLTVLAIIFVLLQWCQEVLIANGDHSTRSLGTVLSYFRLRLRTV